MNSQQHEALHYNLAQIAILLEFAIGATPTSPARNHLCDANIHLEAARNLLSVKQEAGRPLDTPR